MLIDCGVTVRRLQAALAGLGIHPSDIDAVLVTHQHIDHSYCLGLRNPFPARYRIPVYGEPDAAPADCVVKGGDAWAAGLYRRVALAPGATFAIGELAFSAFRTPHNVPTLGFVCSVDGCSVGLATDLGHVSDEVAAYLTGCTHLIFESNHDRAMQLASGRPPGVIALILGDDGHLSNTQAAAALRDLVSERTQTVLLAHLSLDCNLPELARSEAARSLSAARWHGRLHVAPAATPSGWLGA